MAYIARLNNMEQQVTGYARLRLMLDYYCDQSLLPFDDNAVTEFERLRQARVRIGTPDLKIAAIALAHNATLLTQNIRDFEKVPGLRFDDWTI